MKLHPKDMNVGDMFYECDLGYNFEMVVAEKPIKIENKWEWTATNRQGKIVEYLVTEGFEHYGPNIYKYPQYFSIAGEGLNFEKYTR